VIRIRSVLTARRHPLAVASVIAALGLATVVAHATPASDHMGGADDSHSVQSAVVTMCLAVVDLGTAGAGLLAFRVLRRRRFIAGTCNWSDLSPLATPRQSRPPPKARAGPSVLQVYRL
jgi:hypothetical protein